MFKLIMGFTIIILNCLEAKLQHTDNPKILFRYQETYATEFIVLKYQPLDIVLDNFFAKHAWCVNINYTGPDDVFIKPIAFNGSSDSIMGVPKVKDNMFTKWWCVVLQQHKNGKPYSYLGVNYTAQNIVFDLRTKDVKSKNNMNIIYIVCGIGLVAILTATIITCTKKYCCKQTITPLKITIDPDSVFYVNLEIFRRQYDRELQAQEEPEYEEID